MLSIMKKSVELPIKERKVYGVRIVLFQTWIGVFDVNWVMNEHPSPDPLTTNPNTDHGSHVYTVEICRYLTRREKCIGSLRCM